MIEIVDDSDSKTLGESVAFLLEKFEDLDSKELVINSNSGHTQNIFLECMERLVVDDENIIFYGKTGNCDFLNLNNVLSISVVAVF